ncbi:zinc finger MYND domain-containing protein 11-like isoform X2 [Bacillus rossius redtenbacheri]
MSRRRMSCPQITQQLWDAIKVIRYQRQISNIARITRFMSRQFRISEEETRRQLNYCVRDKLIRVIERVGSKGSKIGVKQEGYKLPQGGVEKDKHDWYCFECHSGGDIICCTTCHRVYHLSCISNDEIPDEDVKKTFVCNVCKACKEAEKFKIKRSELNHLLGFTCARLKEKMPPTILQHHLQSKQSYMSDRFTLQPRRGDAFRSIAPEEDASWRVDHLIFQRMDLRKMEEKTMSNKYRHLAEFQADAQTIVHNVVIYHGVNSSLADMARAMLRDCIYDLGEIRQCHDCYRTSNEKKDRHWFCQPCRPPHQLVYAKQKSFPYWPAKVIKMDGDNYDVRFFGGYHQRALIEKSYIQPITANIHSLQIKRTPGWKKASEELTRHQDLLKQAKTEPDSSSEDDVSDSESEVEEAKKPRLSFDAEDSQLEDEDDDEDEEDEQEDDKVLARVESPSVEQTPALKPLTVNDVQPSRPSLRRRSEAEPSVARPLSRNQLRLSGANSPAPVKEPESANQSQEHMVSSTVTPATSNSVAVQTCDSFLKAGSAEKEMPKNIVNGFKEVSEKQVHKFELEKKVAVMSAVKAIEEQLRKEHLAEIRQLKEKHKQLVSETKKKQWCYNCESEAIYHCCWNTAYCSLECQQHHWQKEHKRVCRRKR